mmetsp:Transcript_10582/g.21992  ORF Transcript_10582/g.21992 Transcript_10582/m.21992 type:complete len:461 (-) Transcript_10582:1283-2665(-)
MPTENRTDGGCHSKASKSQSFGIHRSKASSNVGTQESSHTESTRSKHGKIELVSSRKLQWSRVHHSRQFSKRNQGSRESDSANKSSKVDGREGSNSQVTRISKVFSSGSSHCSDTDQRMEGSNCLRKLGGANLRSKSTSNSSSYTSKESSLLEYYRCCTSDSHIGRRGRNTQTHTCHTEEVSGSCSFLICKCSNGTNAQNRSSNGGCSGHEAHVTNTSVGSSRKTGQKRGNRNSIQLKEFLWIFGSTEEVQHFPGNQETTSNIDKGQGGCNGTHPVRGGIGNEACAGVITRRQKKHAANSGTSRNGIGHRHQGRMQGGSDTPHDLISGETSKTKRRHEIDGTGGIRGKAESDQNSSCPGRNHGVFHKAGLAFFVYERLFLFGSEFDDFGNILNGWRWRSKRNNLVRPSRIATVTNQHVLDSIVLEIDLKDALFLGGLRTNTQNKFGNIVGKQVTCGASQS